MQPTAPSERRQTTVAPLELARAMRGLKENSVSYTATTMERFFNPYLDYRIANLAPNHALKVGPNRGVPRWEVEAGRTQKAPCLRLS
jgi:tagaturonate reductase